jgi:hypothetical protein
LRRDECFALAVCVVPDFVPEADFAVEEWAGGFAVLAVESWALAAQTQNAISISAHAALNRAFRIRAELRMLTPASAA